MGVGYATSPLHLTSSVDWSAMSGRPYSLGNDAGLDALAAAAAGSLAAVFQVPIKTRSPTTVDIIIWRDRIAQNYRSQLGEDLFWNQDSTFEKSEDAATTDDMSLHYVAAVIDQRGSDRIHDLAHHGRPSREQLNAVFAEANRRGFAGRFPQLLLGAEFWFPFQRHMVIEEENWAGHVARFGSTFRLMDELDDIKIGIVEADPEATCWTASRPLTPEANVLAAA